MSRGYQLSGLALCNKAHKHHHMANVSSRINKERTISPMGLSVFLATLRSSLKRIHGAPSVRLWIGVVVMASGALLGSASAEAQTLDELRAAARANHPAIKSARLGVDAAGKEVDAASSRYLPSLSMVLEGGGKKQVAEPSRYLRLEQNVWDGGATSAGVDLAKQSAELARSRVPEQAQEIDLQVISAWQTLQSASGRVMVANRLLRLLSEHEYMMDRRVQSGLSTQVELQLVQAQVMQAGLDRRRALLNAHLARLRLEQLSGIEGLRNALVQPASDGAPDQFAAEVQTLQTSDWSVLANRQPAVRRAEMELLAAQARIQTKRSELRPQLYARVDRGLGSGGTTAAFVGVRYSTGAGFAASSEVDALVARAASLEGARDAARLEVLHTLINDSNEIQENLQRYQSLKVSVESSRQIHESYVRQFTAAKKSWLDVMNAIRELSQNEYALNDVQHNFFGLLHRLRVYAAQQP